MKFNASDINNILAQTNFGMGTFINYVDKILTIIVHLPTPVHIWEGILLHTEVRENLHTVDISI